MGKKIIRYLSEKKYLLEDNTEWEMPQETEDTIGNDINGLEGCPKIDVDTVNDTWVILTDEQIKATAEYQAAIESKEMDDNVKKEMKEIALMGEGLIQKILLKVEQLTARVEDLERKATITGGVNLLSKKYCDDLSQSGYLDINNFVNCTYIPYDETAITPTGCIFITDKLQNAVILTKTIQISVKEFRIGLLGCLTGLPNYNYTIQIQLLDDDDSVLPMKDLNSINQTYVIFQDGSNLSDVMVLDASPCHQNVKLKITIVTKGLDGNNDPIKKAFLSAFEIYYNESLS
jgi:hypothetical protein